MSTNLKTAPAVMRKPAWARSAVTPLPPPGVSLKRLLELTRLSPEQAVAVGAAVLRELAELEAGERGHGALSPANIRILADGRVRLVGHRTDQGRRGHVARAWPDHEPGADVRAAGAVICAALGVEPEPVPGRRPHHAESVAPGAVVAARALAQGALGRRVEVAAGRFRESAGRLAVSDRLEASREELATLVVRLQSGQGVAAPRAWQPPLAGPERPTLAGANGRARRALLPWMPAAPRALAALLAIVIGVAGLMLASLSFRQSPAGSRPSALAPQAAAAPATPAPPIAVSQPAEVPVYAPASAGSIRTVALAALQPCVPGTTCRLTASVGFAPAREATLFAWKLEVFDRCDRSAREIPGGRFTAAPGWNRIEVESSAPLPAGPHPLAVVVVTTIPAVVASPPLQVAAGSC